MIKSKVKINIDKRLTDDVVLWRYVPLEKLVHLLDSKSLFLAPLAFFKNSDPLEGHLPRKFHEEFSKFRKEMSKFGSENIDVNNFEPYQKEMWLDIQKEQEKWLARSEIMLEKVRGRPSVCCWFRSDYESEAMWKLYGDNGKSIAIRTTVGDLKKSIEARDNDNLVFLNSIKYVDFNDPNLTIEDIKVEDTTDASILLKRKEYEHENEVRLYHKPSPFDALSQHNVFNDYWLRYEIKPVMINVEPKLLINEVIVSPYVSELYISSVKAVCKVFGFEDCQVSQSKLLEEYDMK
ncbi:DUF2971 domain-containing protein [Vibrio mimicus]